MPTKKSDTKPDFGKAFKELEEIIEWFENEEEPDLDKGIDRFERGLELAKACKDRLDEVDNRVKKIKAKFGEVGE